MAYKKKRQLTYGQVRVDRQPNGLFSIHTSRAYSNDTSRWEEDQVLQGLVQDLSEEDARARAVRAKQAFIDAGVMENNIFFDGLEDLD